MTASSDKIVLYSYRRVFEVERRIYRVDRWAVPVPGGVPLASVGWFLAVEAVVVLLSVLPVTGDLLGVLFWPFRYVAVPLIAAVLLGQAAPDGRLAHRFALDWLGMRFRSPRRVGGRAVPVEGEPVGWSRKVSTRWDADAPALQRARVVGPAVATFNVPVRFRGSWRGWVVARSDRGGETGPLKVRDGVVLEVRP